MKNIWSIIASKTVIDQNSNMVSLFDCVEELSINIEKGELEKKRTLIVPIKFEIVSLWEDEEYSKNKDKERKAEFMISLFDPNGKKLNDFENLLILAPRMKRLRNIIAMEGFPITVAGRYVFKMMFRNSKEDKYQKVSELPLEVLIKSNSVKENNTNYLK